MMTLVNGTGLTLTGLIAVARNRASVQVADEAMARIKASRIAFQNLLEKGSLIYGVNTGVGAQVSSFIGPEQVREFQTNLLRSHAAGVGESLPEEVVRGAILLRLNTFAKGYSAVRPEVARMLEAMLNTGITPVVPETGSLGASGDLAPGAHIALALIGDGEVYWENQRLPTREALQKVNLRPLELAAKEALALINGTHVSTATAAIAVWDATTLAKNADILAALSFEAFGAQTEALHPLVHDIKPQSGQAASASNIRRIVQTSSLTNTREHQDPYSIRCTPQVHSAYRQAVDLAGSVVEAELNSCTDNPLITSDGMVLHSGNFHAQQISQAMDFLTIALCELAVLSKSRIHNLLDPQTTAAKPFLAERPGVESGYMMCEYTAAALISEIKLLTGPSSVESVAVSGSQEDHASMSMTAASKARKAILKLSQVLGAELTCALRALELRGGAEGLGGAPAYLYAKQHVKGQQGDHPLGPEIQEASQLVLSRDWSKMVEEAIGPIG